MHFAIQSWFDRLGTPQNVHCWRHSNSREKVEILNASVLSRNAKTEATKRQWSQLSIAWRKESVPKSGQNHAVKIMEDGRVEFSANNTLENTRHHARFLKIDFFEGGAEVDARWLANYGGGRSVGEPPHPENHRIFFSEKQWPQQYCCGPLFFLFFC